MRPLQAARDIITGAPIDVEIRRARLLAARRYPVGSINRRAILGGYWDAGSVVGVFRQHQKSTAGNRREDHHAPPKD